MRLPLLVAAAALLALLAAAPANAQTDDPTDSEIDVTAETPTQPVPPGTTQAVNLTVAAFCHGPNGPAEGSGVYAGDRTIDLAVDETEAGFDATVTPTTVTLPRGPCEDGTVARNATLDVTVSPQAPAFEQVALRVNAQAEDGSAATEVPVQAGYAPDLQVDTPTDPPEAEPGANVTVPVAVANLGNGRTRVDVALVEAAEDLLVDEPEAFTLAADAESGSATWLLEVTVAVDGDATAGDTLPFSLGLTPAYALDTSRQGPQSQVALGIAVASGSTATAALVPGGLAALLGGGLALQAARNRP